MIPQDTIKPKPEDCKGLMDWSLKMMVYKIMKIKSEKDKKQINKP